MSLPPLWRTEKDQPLCNQCFAASFSKTRGVGFAPNQAFWNQQLPATLSPEPRLLAQERIPARRAAVMAYITNQLLRDITAIQQEAKTEDTTFVIDIDSAVTRRALGQLPANRELPHDPGQPS